MCLYYVIMLCLHFKSEIRNVSVSSDQFEILRDVSNIEMYMFQEYMNKEQIWS